MRPEVESVLQFLQDVTGEGFRDLAVPWYGLTDSGSGILKPVVATAVANQQAARLCDFTNQVGSLHETRSSASFLTAGTCPCVMSLWMSLRFSCSSVSDSPWVM